MSRPRLTRLGRWWIAAALILVCVGSAFAVAQEMRRGRRGRPFELQGNVPYDGRFVFVRLRYDGGLEGFGGFGGFGRREPPWAHDYPRADTNFMKILQEMTYIGPRTDGSNVLKLDDPELHNYPVAYMSEPGFWSMTPDEAAGLRAYMAKGGFLVFDDFRGRDMENLAQQMRLVMPDAQWQPLEVSHPVFHSFFDIQSLDFVQFYDRGLKPAFYGLFEDNDPDRPLIAVANYNNDIGEYWEFSDTGFVPIDLSNEAYKLGVNYVVYALTH